ncbi:hypothetical protein ACSBR2_039761 [Camellia fascicularis]
MTRTHGEVIGNRIGRLVEIVAPSDGLLLHRSFLRLRVERLGHDKLACKFVSREEGLHSGYGPNLRTGPAKSLSGHHSSVRRPMEEVRFDKDKPEPPLPILISCMAARRQGAVRDAASGSATPSPHQLAVNVGVRSVRSCGGDLRAIDPLQVEAPRPRPCSPAVAQELSLEWGPSLHASGLVSGLDPLCNSNSGPPIIEGEAHISLNPALEKSDLPCPVPYFVTEPIECLPLISQAMGTTAQPAIRVQELSPSSSPVRTGPSEPSIDLSISTVFNTLSLKRPLGEEEFCDPVVKKKFKGAIKELEDAAWASLALCVSTPKPKARVLAWRGGTVPVSVVSLGDGGSCTQFGRHSCAEVGGVEDSAHLGRVVVADPEQPQASC